VPLLEFECGECSVVFEELVSGERLPACPECGAMEARRLYSPISPPRRIGLSRAARKDSDLRRSEREAARKESFVEQRKKARRGSGS
jgi:putative FmdB family regulatory protein